MDAGIDVEAGVGALDGGAVAAPRVTVRYWAGARAAAGVESETLSAFTLEELRVRAVERRPGLADVLSRCSFLIDGVRMGADAALSDGVVVEALPPFAGG